jgi:tRNA pseudouridine55 synthase
LLIDKPAGWTSHDVVASVRRQLHTRTVGHAGTLDPFATGLLVVLVAKATRLARFAEGLPKRYDAVVRFGSATDTDDATGRVTSSMATDAWPDGATMRHALDSFVGTYPQRPPAYSAKHVGGTRSHVLARRGQAIDLPSVDVTVHQIELLDWSPPDMHLVAVVSRGTYLRALARDIGERIGIPAHCHALRRTAIGPFDVTAAIAPDAAAAFGLLPMAALLPELPSVVADAGAAREIGYGRRVAQSAPADGRAALVAENGRLLAVADARDGWWYPSVVLEPAT